jgi:hypothetical protein
VWFAGLFLREASKITQAIMIADKQFLLSKITLKTDKEFAEAQPSNNAKARPNDRQRQPINKAQPHLLDIEIFDLPNTGQSEIAAHSQEHHRVEEHHPANPALGGNDPSSLLNDRFIRLCDSPHGSNVNVSHRSQPPVALDLALAQPTVSGWLHRFVR